MERRCAATSSANCYVYIDAKYSDALLIVRMKQWIEEREISIVCNQLIKALNFGKCYHIIYINEASLIIVHIIIKFEMLYCGVQRNGLSAAFWRLNTISC